MCRFYLVPMDTRLTGVVEVIVGRPCLVLPQAILHLQEKYKTKIKSLSKIRS